MALGLSLAAMGCSGDDDKSDDAGKFETPAGTPLPIGALRTFEGLTNNHSNNVIDYPQTPPVGGDHAPAWQDCGFYDGAILNETGVHSMEHGAVWITFRPNLAADQVDQIRALADQTYVLATPWEDNSLGAPIVLSAWGAQLALDALPSPLADDFLATYREGPTAPESGALCTNGINQTKAELG